MGLVCAGELARQARCTARQTNSVVHEIDAPP